MSATAANGAHLLVVDDDQDLLRLLTMRLHAWGYRVSTASSAEEGLARIAVEPPQLVLSDIRLPGKDGLALFDEIRATRPTLPVILLTAHGTIPDAVDAMSRGVFGYLTKPFDSAVLREKIEQALQLSPTGEVPQAGQDEAWRAGLVFRSSRMAELIEEARVVAASDASVLIRGESGTGKEVLARAIHRASPRAGAPFVAINCGAIPEQLLESELFGHVKGAFTGAATAHTGLFQAANGGTLFLDEIGDMPVALQAHLLRVLQERQVTPLGSSKSVAVDVSIICATHRNLREMIDQKLFREDLFYRLNGLAVRLPALRERSDLLALVRRILDQLLQQSAEPAGRGRHLQPNAEVLRLFQHYHWPGNVRQLFNVLRTAAVMAASEPVITREHLSDDFLDEALAAQAAPAAATPAAAPPVAAASAAPAEPAASPAQAQPLPTPVPPATAAVPAPRWSGETASAPKSLEEMEIDAIRRAVDEAGGNISVASKRLGISRNTIYRKLRWNNAG